MAIASFTLTSATSGFALCYLYPTTRFGPHACGGDVTKRALCVRMGGCNEGATDSGNCCASGRV